MSFREVLKLHNGLLNRNFFVFYFRSLDAQGLFLFPL